MAVGEEKMLSKTGDKDTVYDTVHCSACEIESSGKEGGKCIDLKYLESESENKQSVCVWGGGGDEKRKEERKGGGKKKKQEREELR